MPDGCVVCVCVCVRAGVRGRFNKQLENDMFNTHHKHAKLNRLRFLQSKRVSSAGVSRGAALRDGS